MVRSRLSFYWIWFLFLVLPGLGAAWTGAGDQPLAAPDWVPPALESWIPWVLGPEDRRACPVDPMSGAQDGSAGDDDLPVRLCAWPGRLYLELDEGGGLFAQHWQVYAPTWVPLPGDTETWPQSTRSGDQPLPVVLHLGLPAVRLEPGSHAITGRLVWSRPPDGLTLPPETALLSLILDGVPVALPRIERGGRLWIGDPAGAESGEEGDRLGLQVYRQVDDDLPLRVTTRLELDVAGRARQVSLGPVLAPDWIPLRVQSPLPYRLDPDGRIQLQVRPGFWVVEVEGHLRGSVETLRRPVANAGWPDLEVWSFAAHPDLRQVEIAGLEAVDPRQVGAPADWSRLPAYRMGRDDTLVLEVRGRGDPDPGPDRLDLNRDLWLDFDGGGYSVRDRIAGQLTRSWRLEASSPLDLGEVRVDGEPRLITRLTDSAAPGVEVRQGQLELAAEGRIQGPSPWIPASAWDLDLGSIHTRLHLPPGWDLLAVSGVDNLPASWLARWTLLDLFLVLILVFGIGRLWGAGWGLLALLTMALIWTLPGAPRLVWLHLLTGAALLRLVPEVAGRPGMTRLRWLIQWYFRLALVALLLIGLPFLVGQVREGLFPQLARPWVAMGGESGQARDASSQREQEELASGLSARSGADSDSFGKVLAASPPPPPPLRSPDPGALVQSGPGIPDWSWASFDLVWNGPVQPDERARLWLLDPSWHLVWSLAGALLATVLGLRLAGLVGRAGSADPPGGAEVDSAESSRFSLSLEVRAAWFLVPLVLWLPPVGQASGTELPGPELLHELKTRLLDAPDCLPDCVNLANLTLEAGPESLRLVLILDAAAHVAAPVPGGPGGWLPSSVSLDGAPLNGLRRGPDERLLVALVPGRHRIELAGPLPQRTQVEIPFPLRPRRVSAQVEGWTLEGLDAAGHPGSQIRLVRLSGPQGEGDGPLTQGALPPLLMIERNLNLGLDWRVETRARRLSPAEYPVVLPVPLLPGEAVVTPGAQIRDGRLLVSLAPGETETSWSSTLEQHSSLSLRAANDPAIAESWSLDLAPLWHVRWDGMAPVRQVTESNRWLPSWRPVPGVGAGTDQASSPEGLDLHISRPAAIPGPTLTLERVAWSVRPGRRMSESQVQIALRSTQGGTHNIRLPSGAVPLRLQIDGGERPLPPAGSELVLPLVPGAQSVLVQWREPQALGMRLRPEGPDLGSRAVNLSVSIAMPQERWVLALSGPSMGPVVLLWGLLLVLAGLALALGRSGLTPLKARDWLLLGIGLSLAQIWVALLVAGWLFALGWRRRLDDQGPHWRYNLVQVALILLTLAALAGLVSAVSQGLLGQPQMQILGNGSHGGLLNWYQDRGGPGLPRVEVISAPIWVYRALMLAWALWLALRLLDWLRWGWVGFARPVLWREGPAKGPAGLRGMRRGEPRPGP